FPEFPVLQLCVRRSSSCLKIQMVFLATHITGQPSLQSAATLTSKFKIRRKTMPLPHQNVTARVSITGLALGCYNKATQNYEVGMIRQKTHTLTIEVKKQLPNGLSRMIFQTEDSQHRIFIDAENARVPDREIFTVGETLDRNDRTHDSEDFRWVIDFEMDLNGKAEVDLKPPKVPVTEMYISKPQLYADTNL